MTVYEKIKAMQPKEQNVVWMLGEQLADICRARGAAAEELVLQDLDNPAQSLAALAAKMKALADQKHREKKGACIIITPMEAEKLICEFYGISGDAEPVEAKPAEQEGQIVDLFDLL